MTTNVTITVCMQTDPRHHEEGTRNTDSHNTIQVKQPALFMSKMIAELERVSRTKLENSDPTQNSHNQWEQH